MPSHNIMCVALIFSVCFLQFPVLTNKTKFYCCALAQNTTVSSNHQTTRSMPTPQVSMRSGESSTTPVSPWVTASEADQENAQDRKHITKLKRDKMYLKDLLKEMGERVHFRIFEHSTLETVIAN